MTDHNDPDRAPASDRAETHVPWRQAELQRLVADIAARLRKSCAHLSDDEFSKLVVSIAKRRMRFDGADPITGRRADDTDD